MEWILAIDPGNEESAYVLLDPDLRPVEFGKQHNELMYANMCAGLLKHIKDGDDLHVAIEMIASYGMPVGREVFETCVWIGRLLERFKKFETSFVYRKDEKMTICQSMRGTGGQVRPEHNQLRQGNKSESRLVLWVPCRYMGSLCCRRYLSRYAVDERGMIAYGRYSGRCS